LQLAAKRLLLGTFINRARSVTARVRSLDDRVPSVRNTDMEMGQKTCAGFLCSRDDAAAAAAAVCECRRQVNQLSRFAGGGVFISSRSRPMIDQPRSQSSNATERRAIVHLRLSPIRPCRSSRGLTSHLRQNGSSGERSSRAIPWCSTVLIRPCNTSPISVSRPRRFTSVRLLLRPGSRGGSSTSTLGWQ